MIEHVFTKKLWLLFGLMPMIESAIVILYLFGLLPSQNIASFGVNKTVGWAWDFVNVSPIIAIMLASIFFLVYGILAVLRVKTNLWTSIAQVLAFLPLLGWSFHDPAIRFWPY